MPASALLKFTQGATVGGDGHALIGVLTTSVAVSNVNNGAVASWQIDLVYADPTSARVPATPYAFSDGSSTPAVSFIPDVRRSYRWVLQVWSVPNRVGAPDSVDIRVFSVPTLNGNIVPPLQNWPLPLPDPRTGEPNAKPDEMNFGGQALGWHGTGSDGLLNQVLAKQLPPTPGNTDDVLTVFGGRWVSLPPKLGIDAVTGFVDLNVPSLSAFVVAQAGNYTFAQNDVVALGAQATVAQNGDYVVGFVSGGTAPLTLRTGVGSISNLGASAVGRSFGVLRGKYAGAQVVVRTLTDFVYFTQTAARVIGSNGAITELAIDPYGGSVAPRVINRGIDFISIATGVTALIWAYDYNGEGVAAAARANWTCDVKSMGTKDIWSTRRCQTRAAAPPTLYSQGVQLDDDDVNGAGGYVTLAWSINGSGGNPNRLELALTNVSAGNPIVVSGAVEGQIFFP